MAIFCRCVFVWVTIFITHLSYPKHWVAKGSLRRAMLFGRVRRNPASIGADEQQSAVNSQKNSIGAPVIRRVGFART